MKFLSQFAISGLLIILLSHEINQSDAELLAKTLEDTFDSIADTKKQVNVSLSINHTSINACREKNTVQSILRHSNEGEKLDKYDVDFNQSDSRNCYNFIVQEVRNGLSLSINEVSKKVQAYYDDLVQSMQDKIDSFLNSTAFIDTRSTSPERFLYKLDTGNYTMFRLIEEIKKINTAEELSTKIISSVKSLNDDIFVNVSKIVNQAQHLDFYGRYSSQNLKSYDPLTWISPFQNIMINLEKSKIRIHERAENIAKEVKNKIESNVKDIGTKLMKYFMNQEKKLNHIESLYDIVAPISRQLSDVSVTANMMNQTIKCTQAISDNVNKLNIADTEVNISTKYISSNTVRYGVYLDFLDDLTRQSDNGRFKCNNGWNKAQRYLAASRHFYYFLPNLYERLSGYDVQKNTSRCNKYLNNITYTEENVRLVEIISKDFLSECFSDYENYGIEYLTLNQHKLNKLNKVLDFTLKSNLLKTCDYDEGNKLVVKGNYVRLSDLQKHDCQTPLKSIEVYALKRVFIDVDMNETDKNLQLSIIAPSWDVQGTRYIILDGKPGKAHKSEKANNGTIGVTSGDDGKPGLPGDPGGNFLGIGADFINAEYLTVTSNGGKGGPGQIGGDGAKGPYGVSPPTPNDMKHAKSLCEYTDGLPLTCNKRKTLHAAYADSNHHRYEITLYGSNGGLGGNGGNGGKGGYGGKPGIVIFIILSNNDIRPHTSATSGDVGIDGDGGNFGMNGTAGSDLEVVENAYWAFIHTTIDFEKKVIKPSANTIGPTNNWPGTRGFNTAGRKEAKDADKFENPSYIINNYKNYLRENLPGSVREIEMRDFLNKLEYSPSNKDNPISINDLSNAFGYTHELYGLENQALILQEKISFLPFYESLFDRVNQYKKKMKSDTNFVENQKVSDYLLAAILSKIYRIKNNLSSYLVIDINKYFESVKEDIKEYKNTQHQVQIDKYNKQYQNTLSTQIKEGINLIENDVLPEMDKIIEETNENIHLLVNETITLQERSREEKLNLIDKMSRLQAQFIQEMFLSILKAGSVLLGFAGPVGAAAGAGIGILVTGYETFGTDNTIMPTPVPTTLPAAVGQSFTRVSDLIKVEQKKFEEQLNMAQIMLDEISKTDFRSNITGIKQQIQKIQDKLKKITPEKLNDDPSLVTKVHKLKNKVVKLTKNEIELVEQEKSENDPLEIKRKIKENQKNILAQQEKGKTKDPASINRLNELQKEKIELTTKYSESLTAKKPEYTIKTEKYLKVLTHIQTGVSLGNVAQEAYSKIKTHFSRVDEFDKNIQQTTNNIKKLKKYETNIYQLMTPMIEVLNSKYTDVIENSQNKSHMSLDVIKWKIQSTFKDVQIHIREMTQGFQVQVGLTRCIEKFEYGVLAVIQMYDRIQDAYEKKELSRYIANVHSEVPITNNEELNQQVNKLDLVTRSNLVMYEYGRAIDAFKQYTFPFADLYLTKFDYNTTHNNLSDLVDAASKEMDDLIKEKNRRSSVIDSDSEADSYLEIVFGKKPDGAGEFVVWDHNMYHKEISSLLKGEEIMINADITRAGLDYNAVKFNEIGIQFRLQNNESLEKKMYQSLQNFTIEMTHLGSSYYKCDDKFYTITHSPQKMKHDAFSENEIYKISNEVYSKIIKNPPLLSPYTMWKLKLSNQTKTTFGSLSEFVDQPIDLALIGKGKYVGNNHAVCNATILEKYYKVADISTIN